MNGGSLSIAIPTYKRPQKLKRLLESIRAQIEASPSLAERVKVYIYDNNSQDETRDVSLEAGLGQLLRYSANPSNIGGDPNILKAYTETPGDYIWACGDDDWLLPGAIEDAISKIDEEGPAIIINQAGFPCDKAFKPPFKFDSYRELVRHAVKTNPSFLLAQGLITRNIIVKGAFDVERAKASVKSDAMSNQLAIASALFKQGGKAIVAERQFISWESAPSGWQRDGCAYCDPVCAESEAAQRIYDSIVSGAQWIAAEAGCEKTNFKNVLLMQKLSLALEKKSMFLPLELALTVYWDFRRRSQAFAKCADFFKRALLYESVKKLVRGIAARKAGGGK